MPFAENPSNGDCRVCGSLTFSIGGIPLLYSSDEVGKLNDYSYRFDDTKKHDDRWVNRTAVTRADTELALGNTPPANPTEIASLRVFSGLRKMIAIRKQNAIFGQSSTQILDADNHHCFAFLRENTQGHTVEINASPLLLEPFQQMWLLTD